MGLKKLSFENLAKLIGQFEGIVELEPPPELKKEEEKKFGTCYQVF